jgi:hypothetical protein
MYQDENDCIINVASPSTHALQINNVKPNIQLNYILISINYKKMYLSIPNFEITFHELKQIINKKFDIPINKIQLYYNNYVIIDSYLLSDYDITSKSMIYVYIKSNNQDDVIIHVNI